MIHHLSIAARDPKRAAEVLAELMGGSVVFVLATQPGKLLRAAA